MTRERGRPAPEPSVPPGYVLCRRCELLIPKRSLQSAPWPGLCPYCWVELERGSAPPEKPK